MPLDLLRGGAVVAVGRGEGLVGAARRVRIVSGARHPGIVPPDVAVAGRAAAGRAAPNTLGCPRSRS